METNAATCLEEYCALLGYKLKTTTNNDEGAGTRQAQFEEEILNKCPHALQIHERSVRFHYMAAKGPVYARSFIRKILGDEGVYVVLLNAFVDYHVGSLFLIIIILLVSSLVYPTNNHCGNMM